VVLFLDAAHFVQSAFLGSIWSFTRLFIQTSSGRQRWNVLGALDAVSRKVHTFCNDTYINSESVCCFLKQLRSTYGALAITIFLDNARYQRCKLVMEVAKSLNITLMFLPSYSPNLNLIERFWKFVKKKALYSKYYDNFDLFKKSINDCITDSIVNDKTELLSLLSWNFQLFNKVHILTD
jgi:transposase